MGSKLPLLGTRGLTWRQSVVDSAAGFALVFGFFSVLLGLSTIEAGFDAWAIGLMLWRTIISTLIAALLGAIYGTLLDEG